MSDPPARISKRPADDASTSPLFSGVIGSTRDAFEPKPTRAVAPTSIDALKSRARDGDQRRILELLAHGPQTIEQIADGMQRVASAVSGRFSELAKLGLAVKTNTRRKTRSGSSGAVWMTTAAGAAAARTWAAR